MSDKKLAAIVGGLVALVGLLGIGFGWWDRADLEEAQDTGRAVVEALDEADDEPPAAPTAEGSGAASEPSLLGDEVAP